MARSERGIGSKRERLTGSAGECKAANGSKAGREREGLWQRAAGRGGQTEGGITAEGGRERERLARSAC